jgi:CHASE2 domain-containing sensor protein
MKGRLVAGVLAALLAAAAWGAGVLGPLERESVDARYAVRGPAPAAGVVVVAIDERSISALGDWPWRRRLHAEAVDRLRQAGAREIVYDVQFTEPSPHPADDVALYRALGRAGGAVLATGASDDRGHTTVLGGDAMLARIHSRAGAANFPTDSGGVIRRYALRIGRLPTLAAVVAQRLHHPLSPADFAADGTAPLDFHGGPGGFPRVSFSDLLAGRVPRSVLRGKIVVVGATAPTLQDRHATATSGTDTMAGPELQANAIATALRGNPLRDGPGWLAPVLIALLALAVPLASLRARARVVSAVAGGLALVTLAGAQLAFDHGRIVPVAAPLLALALGTVGALVVAYLIEATRRRRAATHTAALEREVAARTRELRATQLEVIQRLGRAAEHRDDETGSHLKRMSLLCGRLARAAGADDARADEIEQASLLHDIGKIGIPDGILHKPGKLEPHERAIMQTHTIIGAELLEGSPSRVLQTAELIARTHHERWDGTGYPAGLRGDDIPWVGRIAALCDVYDALLTARPYKRAWSAEEALAHIEAESGAHFDPTLAAVFVALVRADLPEAGLHSREWPPQAAHSGPTPPATAPSSSTPPARRSRTVGSTSA